MSGMTQTQYVERPKPIYSLRGSLWAGYPSRVQRGK